MFLHRIKRTTNDVLRRRLIRETEQALLFGLTHPEKTVRIPTVEVGRSVFHPRFARAWWAQTLGLDVERLSNLQGPINGRLFPSSDRMHHGED